MTNKDNEIISIEEDSEDQGILFEKNLKSNTHITLTVKRANQLVDLIKRTFSYLDKVLLLTFYKTLIMALQCETQYEKQVQRNTNNW